MCRCGARLEPAKAHNRNGTTAPRGKTFALPNIMTAVRAGDFEAVTTYRIGPAKRSRRYTVFTLTDPARVVVDVRAAFPTIQRRVYFSSSASLASRAPLSMPRRSGGNLIGTDGASGFPQGPQASETAWIREVRMASPKLA